MYSIPEKFRDNIMVCKTRLLYREFPFEGFLPASGYNFAERITKIHEWQERVLVEDDATYQQIIPYVLCYNPEIQSFLIYQRAANHEEHTISESERFANKRSLGIGGHIAENTDHDFAPDEFLIELAKEILEEEVGNIGVL
jgi:predicted NUDIX family phosphoesterase